MEYKLNEIILEYINLRNLISYLHLNKKIINCIVIM